MNRRDSVRKLLGLGVAALPSLGLTLPQSLLLRADEVIE